MNIIFIHGANASKASWNWVSSHLSDHNVICLEWNINSTSELNLQNMNKRITNNCILIGHSMGALYSWHLAARNTNKVIGAISIAAPWGGSIQASILQLFNINLPWLKMLSRDEPWTAKARSSAPPVPWTNVVTTCGFTLFGIGANDGVLTTSSQKELCGPHTEILLKYGHNEVLQSFELIEIIKTTLATSRFNS